MRTLILAASLLALSATATAQVSVSVGQPGFYGRIDIGGMPPPAVIYREPIIVQRPVRVIEQPLYLRVPAGHSRNWSRYCRSYGACGRKVYFVRDNWYLNDYAPRYRERHHIRHAPPPPRHHAPPPRHDVRHDNRGHDNRGHDRGHDNRGHDRGHDDRGHGGHGR